jgi:hypothetical protein
MNEEQFNKFVTESLTNLRESIKPLESSELDGAQETIDSFKAMFDLIEETHKEYLGSSNDAEKTVLKNDILHMMRLLGSIGELAKTAMGMLEENQ